jgi:serine/threonine-protein kinase
MPTLGRYEVIEELGKGSMGSVCRARDPLMDRDVAIKQILAPAGSAPDAEAFRERFFREARAAGRLAHPGIVRVFDVSEQDGIPFLVMEYIAGRTLHSILQSGERMSLECVCDLGIQLAEALDYAHENGVIHRDIKPSNILITAENCVKIADFGIAKLAESQMTMSGQILGTPAFMAPEQFTGMPVDRRSDLFSLGVVLYCMTTGERPFAGDTILGLQYRVLHTLPVDPGTLNPAVSRGLDAVILKCIEKDPAVRYQTGGELARDLRAWLAHQPISAMGTHGDQPHDGTLVLASTPESPRMPEAPPTKHRRLNVGLVALVSFLVTFLGVTTLFLAKKLGQKPPAPGVETVEQQPVTASAPAVPAPPNAVPAPPNIDNGTETAPEAIQAAVETMPSESLKQKDLAAVKDASIANPKRVPTDRAVQSRSPAAPEPAPPVMVPVSLPLPPAPIPRAIPELPVRENPAIVPRAPDNSAQVYNSAKLLVASVAVPEPLAIIVTIDNEPFFSRNATGAPPVGFEDSEGHIRLSSVPSVPLSEERNLPPGKHKIQVNVLMASQRVSKVQEITERFFPGQRRILQIEFLPESDGPRGRATLFKIKLR